MSEKATESAEATVAPRPTNSWDCYQHASRVLRFAEGETNPQQFEQYMTLAERWMQLAELGAVMDGGQS